MTKKPIFVITDCSDDNAKVRMTARNEALFPGSAVTSIGVRNTAEAGGMLVDTLDALLGTPAIILLNVAPRNDEVKEWKNGSPFGAYRYHDTLVVGTIDGYTYSFLKKVLDESVVIDVYDMDATLPHLGLDQSTFDRIKDTQFRSFEYLPRLARHLSDESATPLTATGTHSAPVLKDVVWWIDSFGNIKTSILASELDAVSGDPVRITVERMNVRATYYVHLKDIPAKHLGVTIGSSGLGAKRFLEIQWKGADANFAAFRGKQRTGAAITITKS